MIDTSKHIWEGWTVGDFIEALQPELDRIMNGRSWRKPLRNRHELEAWCCSNQPYYKQLIPEVVDYFAEVYGTEESK